VIERLKKRRQFKAAAAGSRFARPAFVLQALRREDGGPARIGFTVSKRVARKAVARNRIRRRLKEAARLAAPAAEAGTDYVVIARSEALAQPFATLAAEFGRGLRLAGGRRRGPGHEERDGQQS